MCRRLVTQFLYSERAATFQTSEVERSDRKSFHSVIGALHSKHGVTRMLVIEAKMQYQKITNLKMIDHLRK